MYWKQCGLEPHTDQVLEITSFLCLLFVYSISVSGCLFLIDNCQWFRGYWQSFWLPSNGQNVLCAISNASYCKSVSIVPNYFKLNKYRHLFSFYSHFSCICTLCKPSRMGESIAFCRLLILYLYDCHRFYFSWATPLTHFLQVSFTHWTRCSVFVCYCLCHSKNSVPKERERGQIIRIIGKYALQLHW